MEQEIIIVNPEKFEETKKKITEGGTNKLHVLADFDRTVTYGVTKEGKRTETVIAKLRSDPKYLGEDYTKEAFKLFDIYHPIEIDPEISLEEKTKKMHEWWKKHFDLIANSGLTKEIIARVISEKPLNFREGTKEFFDSLDQKGIPLVFMSAGPGDMVVEYFKQGGLMGQRVYVVANKYSFGETGKAIQVEEPIIHTFNKKEVLLKGTPMFEKVEGRKNVLLLGDSVGDAEMIEGFDYDNLIKIGFLNENVEESLDEFKKNFDVLLTGDQDFSFVNKLMGEIFNEN